MHSEFLGIEDACRPSEVHLLGSGDLQYRPLGRERPAQNHEPTVRLEGIGRMVHHRLPWCFLRLGDRFGERLSGEEASFTIDEPSLQ